MKIFLIANSFGLDSSAWLWNVLRDAGMENVTVAVAYIGGCSLDRHWDNMQSGSREYEYHKNVDGTFRITRDISLLEMLTDEHWDIITLQQAGNRHAKAENFARLDEVVGWVNAHKTNPDAKIWYNMVWPYSSASQDTVFLHQHEQDCEKMYDAIELRVRQIVAPSGWFAGIIPSGTAIQYLRHSHLTEADLYRDELHLSYSYGRYTVALVWYAKLFGGDVTKIRWIPKEFEALSKELPLIYRAVDHALQFVNDL